MRIRWKRVEILGIWGVSAYHSDRRQGLNVKILNEVRTGWTSLIYLAPEQVLLNPHGFARVVRAL